MRGHDPGNWPGSASSLGEHSGYEASNPVRVGKVACGRFRLEIFGEGVGMMSVGVGRRSHVADFSRAFSHLTLIFVARDIRAARAAATRAAR